MGFYERAQAYKQQKSSSQPKSDMSLYYTLRDDLEEQLSVEYVIDLAKRNKAQAELEVKKLVNSCYCVKNTRNLPHRKHRRLFKSLSILSLV